MAISFTGSSATGSAIIANTSERVGATFLELGGKSALVVFDDVDTDAAVKTVMNGLLTNGGQICTAHSRLIVHKNMAPKLLPALKTALEKVEFATSPLEDVDALPGWDNMWGGKLQPVVSEGQFVKIKGFLADAKAAGAKFLTGGDTPAPKGYFFSPTVITDVGINDDVWQKVRDHLSNRHLRYHHLILTHPHLIFTHPHLILASSSPHPQQEVFGPVLVVREFDGEGDAVSPSQSAVTCDV